MRIIVTFESCLLDVRLIKLCIYTRTWYKKRVSWIEIGIGIGRTRQPSSTTASVHFIIFTLHTANIQCVLDITSSILNAEVKHMMVRASCANLRTRAQFRNQWRPFAIQTPKPNIFNGLFFGNFFHSVASQFSRQAN